MGPVGRDVGAPVIPDPLRDLAIGYFAASETLKVLCHNVLIRFTRLVFERVDMFILLIIKDLSESLAERFPYWEEIGIVSFVNTLLVSNLYFLTVPTSPQNQPKTPKLPRDRDANRPSRSLQGTSQSLSLCGKQQIAAKISILLQFDCSGGHFAAKSVFLLQRPSVIRPASESHGAGRGFGIVANFI